MMQSAEICTMDDQPELYISWREVIDEDQDTGESR